MGPMLPFLLRGAIASIALFAAYRAGKKSVARHRRRTFVAGLEQKIAQLKKQFSGTEDPEIQRAIEELESLLSTVAAVHKDQELDVEIKKFFSGEFFQDLMEGMGDVVEEAEQGVWKFFDDAANALDDHIVEPLIRTVGSDRHQKEPRSDKATKPKH